MKKLFCLIVVVGLGITTVSAQGFKLGANIGIITGDASDFFNLNIGLDVNFLWQASDEFDVGLAAGFTNGFGEDEIDDAQFLPLSVAGRFNASEQFVIGGDIGYAVGIDEGNEGGFYYRPMVGYNISETAQINVSYTGISMEGGFNWSTINLGVMFEL